MAYFRKKRVVRRAPKKAVRKGGRRTQGYLDVVKGAGAMGEAVIGGNIAGGYLRGPYKAQKAKARSNYKSRLETSDNVTSAGTVTVGKQRKIGFQEKVTRAYRPPFEYKRNYQFSAEGYSARKTWFSIDINQMNSVDLALDITTYKGALLTNTATADAQVTAFGAGDGSRFYVDKNVETIKMMNSSTNSCFGKIHLIAHKRDNDGVYVGGSALINPVNLMMWYSSASALSNLTAGLGAENVVGNGFRFDNATSGLNWTSSYNMPGSTLTVGPCAPTDASLHLFHSTIKKQMDFWFRKVNTKTFSLKPGQQCNFRYVFNDLKKIFREQQEFLNLAGVTYHLVVEFESQIVGNSLTTDIATGSTQLSVIRDSTRILGLENTLRPNVFLQTAGQTAIADANQVTINSDSGVLDIGVEKDL